MKDIKFFSSKKFNRGLVVIGILATAIVIFKGGEFVGYNKAAFAYNMGDNYYRAFGPHPSPNPITGMMGEVFDDNDHFPQPYGASGKIVKIALPSLIIASIDGIEKTVSVTDDTIIRRLRDDLSSNNLKVGSDVIVFGSPDTQSGISARLIRVLPGTATTTSSVATPPKAHN